MTNRVCLIAAVLAAVLAGSFPAAAAPIPLSQICGPGVTNPYLIKECLDNGGSIDPAALAAAQAEQRRYETSVEDAAAVVDALLPDNTPQFARDYYRQDVLRYGKYAVVACYATSDYAKCITLSAALAR